MSVRSYIPFASRILSFVARVLLTMSGDTNEIELFVGHSKGKKENGLKFRVKLIREPVRD